MGNLVSVTPIVDSFIKCLFKIFLLFALNKPRSGDNAADSKKYDWLKPDFPFFPQFGLKCLVFCFVLFFGIFLNDMVKRDRINFPV